MKKTALIVAGGTGERIGGTVPKQFVTINGKPLLIYTLERFDGIADEIVLVLPSEHFSTWSQVSENFKISRFVKVVSGGTNRSESVRNGLEFITGDGIVAIHDAVRPFVSKILIENLFTEAAKFGNAIPVFPVKESLRKITGSRNIAVNRMDFVNVQTPQCFNIQKIKKAYTMFEGNSLTDDASVAELAGETIHLVNGETNNIKITFPEDLIIAEALINASIV